MEELLAKADLIPQIDRSMALTVFSNIALAL
jgi:hypothetical protein